METPGNTTYDDLGTMTELVQALGIAEKEVRRLERERDSARSWCGITLQSPTPALPAQPAPPTHMTATEARTEEP